MKHLSRFILVFAVAGLWFGAAVSAPIPAQTARDVATIKHCLPPAGDATEPRDCIGPISSACQDEPEGSTTPGIVACLLREEAAWDAILNENYKTLMASLDASRKAAVRNAQRQWIPSRDADCIALWEINREGTIRSVAAASCRLDATANRAIWLEYANQN